MINVPFFMLGFTSLLLSCLVQVVNSMISIDRPSDVPMDLILASTVLSLLGVVFILVAL